MKKYHALIFQIVFFLFVGVVTLGIDIGVTAACFYILGFPAYLASAVGFLSGFFFNFPMNRKRVFRHADSDRFGLKTQVTFYAALCIFNLIATSGIVQLLVEWDFAIQYAKIFVTALIAVWNFCIFKLFIFSKRST